MSAERPSTLTLEAVADGFLPAARVEEFHPDRFSFFWTADYAGFRPTKLLWWDDESYRAYQAGDDA